MLALVDMSDFQPARQHESLGDAFYDRVAPADFPQTILRHRDQRWAARMGLADLTDDISYGLAKLADETIRGDCRMEMDDEGDY